VALPVTVDLKAYRGDSFVQTMRLEEGGNPHDLSGSTLEAEARSLTGSPGELVVPLVVDVPNPTSGEFTLELPASPPPAGVYRYDVEETLAGKVTTWVAGELVVDRDVTNEL
jgi:hypothetical protein